MKPRTAVATYLLAAVTAALANKTALEAHARSFKKNGKPINAKQAARLQAVGAFYADEIKTVLANAQFEGDTAEIEGVTTTSSSNGAYAGETSAANDGEVNGAQFNGADDLAGSISNGSQDLTFLGRIFGPAPSLVINVHGDVVINH